MQIYGEIASFKKIKLGVRQGCVLFSLYSEIIILNLNGYPGGHNENKLRFADGAVLSAENKDLPLHRHCGRRKLKGKVELGIE